jgi:hypothetical protein
VADRTTAAPARSRRGGATVEPPPASFIALNHPDGRQTRLRVGFAWDLFLLTPLFGLPLFLRRLPQWGAAILALWLIDLGAGWLLRGQAGAAPMQVVLFAAFLLVQLWLGVKGNELTAKALLAHGWTVDHPEFVAIRRVMERWGLKR